MALADGIRDLEQSSLTALDAIHDYYVHTKHAWRLVEQVVAEGRRFSLRNRATGTLTDQDALIRLAQRYVADQLTSSTFQQFVSVFEDFLFDLLRLWLATYPGSLADKDVKFGAVLRAADKAAITDAVVSKELNELRYERVADWFAYLEKKAKLGCPTAGDIEKIAEIKASRDILVHNKGIANATYVAKAGGCKRYDDGERLEISKRYHRSSWATIKNVVRDIAEAAIRKT